MLAKGPVESSRTTTMPARLKARRTVYIGVASLLLLILVAAIVAVPVVGSRDVAFYVNGKPVTEAHVSAMTVDLPFDATSEFYTPTCARTSSSGPRPKRMKRA
ncbi:MAG: hypothetical protein NTX94_04145 [Caldiserica bacterium]|nr:hypothetical protein [Caldisericota bacterium]